MFLLWIAVSKGCEQALPTVAMSETHPQVKTKWQNTWNEPQHRPKTADNQPEFGDSYRRAEDAC